MNHIVLVGYIGKKGVELKFASSSGKAVATYSLSVPRQFSKGDKKEYDFLNCVTWGSQAEWLANNADKIKKVAIEGRIQTRNYEGKNGKVYVTEIITSEIEVVEWATSSPNNIANNEYKGDNNEMELDDSGSDIPF